MCWWLLAGLQLVAAAPVQGNAMRPCTRALPGGGTELVAIANCCGNFVCEPSGNGETEATCPEDCAAAPTVPTPSLPTPAPVAYLPRDPTLPPRPSRGACRNYDEWISNDTSAVGHGVQWCNLCHCLNGELNCGPRHCGEPLGGQYPENAALCSHMTCSLPSNATGGHGLGSAIQVQHTHRERHGELHSCAWHRVTKSCECVCWSNYAHTCGSSSLDEHCEWPSKQSGVTLLEAATAPRCAVIPFPTPFAGAGGAARVVLTMQRSADTAAMPWVSSSTHAGFSVCWTHSASVQRLHWYAFQGEQTSFTGRKPFVGALAGASPLSNKGQTGWAAGRRTCSRIIFPQKFRGWDDTTPPIPVIFGSVQAHGGDIDGDTTTLGRGFAHWIEELTLDGFTACFEAQAASATGSLQFNWFAFEQEGVGAMWPGHEADMGLSEVGRALAPAAAEGIVHEEDGARCAWVPFGSSSRRVDCDSDAAAHSPTVRESSPVGTPTGCPEGYTEPPLVIVTALAAPQPHGVETALSTYVTSVESKRFRVCTRERPAGAPHRDALRWDWMTVAHPSLAAQGRPITPGHYMPVHGDAILPCGSPAFVCTNGAREAVRPGYYSVLGTPETRSGTRLCGSPRYFCAGGVRKIVAAGHYSMGGTVLTRSAQAPCGGNAWWCQNGHREPVSSGWYTAGGKADGTTRTRTMRCGGKGWWCSGGVRRAVQLGYVSVGGRSSGDERTGVEPCGGDRWFCRNGIRREVPAGYYAAGGDRKTRTHYKKCGDAAHYCIGGVRHQVSIGFMSVRLGAGAGDDKTLATAEKPCPEGWKCRDGVLVEHVPAVRATHGLLRDAAPTLLPDLTKLSAHDRLHATWGTPQGAKGVQSGNAFAATAAVEADEAAAKREAEAAELARRAAEKRAAAQEQAKADLHRGWRWLDVGDGHTHRSQTYRGAFPGN